MYFMNTEMHMVTFLITMFEVVMLVFQIIYFLQRPSDKSRLQYLILLVCLILYNVCSGLFTDPDLPVPTTLQTILAYLVGFTMSMYVIYYFYKVFDLKHLKFFATYGLILFLFLPFAFLFVVPYLLTNDTRMSAQLTVIVPFFYGLGFLYSVSKALWTKFKTKEKEGSHLDDPLYVHAKFAYISMVCWAALPVIVFFGDFQVLEHSVTNAGFLMMTIIYVKSAIKQSRNEYEKLLESERNLQSLNTNLKRKVRKRTKKLEEVMEARKITFINLAHETKTPLTLINNYLSDYIDKHGENEEIRVVKNNLKRLTKDIVNFFDIESYEKGFSIYNHDRIVNFSKLLQNKAPLFESAALRKQINVEFNINCPLYVHGHPGALDRIVNNLIENAIKYSRDKAKILVTLAQDNNSIVFSVEDNGPGIPEAQQTRIFEPYFKLSIEGHNCGGMGMGLAIVKKIIEDLSGEIILNSSSMGTLIKVVLPTATLADSAEEPLQTEDIEFAQHQLEFEESIQTHDRAAILIVEDNEEMLNFLIKKMKVNYNVYFARNGNEALEKLRGLNNLDLIISDVMMPDMDGFEFCQSLGSLERYAHIPIVFLSAKCTDDDRIKGLSLGAVDYMQKPFKIQELLIKVESILGKLKHQRAAIVSKAYQNILAENGYGIAPRTVSHKRCAFTENCKKYRLTAREVEIIKLLIKGLPYKLIGDQLSISDKTVAKHISNIFTKVEVNNKVELMNRLEAQEVLNYPESQNV